MSLGLLTWDSPENCKGLPYTKLKLREAILSLCQTCQTWATCEEQILLKSLDELLQSRSKFMAYDKNGDFRKSFGAELLEPRLGWTWLFGKGTSGLVLDEDWKVGPNDLRLHEGKFCWWQWRVDGTVDFPMAVKPRDGHLVILPVALEMCIDWVKRPELFDEYTSAQKIDARFAVGHQLREVSSVRRKVDALPRPTFETFKCLRGFRSTIGCHITAPLSLLSKFLASSWTLPYQFHVLIHRQQKMA